MEVREFTNKFIRPASKIMEENQCISRELISQFAEKGFLGVTLPKKYGGMELDSLTYGLFIEEIGKACCAMRTLVTVQTSLIGETISKYGNEEQKELWLPEIISGKKIGAFALTEPEIGSDAKNIETKYIKNSDQFIINGKKKWISFGEIADFYVVIANCEGVKTAFLVDRESEGIQVSPIKGMLAGRATHIAEIQFNNVKVTRDRILGEEGAGFSFIVSAALDSGRYCVAWGAMGIAQEALECMVRYSRNRKQFNQKLHSHQLIQGIIGDAVTEIHAARAFCLHAGQLREQNHLESTSETSMAKYFTSKMAMKIAQDAVQLYGGNGCYSEFPVERLFREAKILEIIEGSSQIQQILASQYALRKYYTKST